MMHLRRVFGLNRGFPHRYCCRGLLLLLLCVVPAFAFALGFGEVKLHSYIDEPMDAEIELLGAESYEPERILVSLASAQEFKRAALARPFLLSQLQFQVLRNAANTVIRVTSHDPIHQPYLEFLIDLSWPGGRLVRGYTLLLDPAPAGIAPLHERRPPVVPRAIKENKVNTQPATATAAVNVGAANNFTQQNTFSQHPLSQNTQAQTINSQTVNSQPINAQTINSHQKRFEKLFDERNGEANFNQDTAPMTIVSAPDTVSPGVAFSQNPAYGTAVNAAANAAIAQTSQGYSQQQGQMPAPAMLQANQYHTQTEIPLQNRMPSSLGNLDKIQWMLIAIVASILLLCITLIVIFARRNKQKLNEAHAAMPQAIFPGTSMQAPVYSQSSQPPQGATAVETTHAALYGGGLTLTPATPTFAEARPARSQEDIKINPTIPNEMTMKLALAKNYFEIGDDESALTLLEDVALRGTEWEKQTAQRMLAENANAEGVN